MDIESDEQFEKYLRERFSAKPYKDWTPEMYESLIADLMAKQREIRAASLEAPIREDGDDRDTLDATLAKWAIWSICAHDVGATPTHWHRVWSALRNVISSARSDEERRISEALREENMQHLGPTARKLVEQAEVRAHDCYD